MPPGPDHQPASPIFPEIAAGVRDERVRGGWVVRIIGFGLPTLQQTNSDVRNSIRSD